MDKYLDIKIKLLKSKIGEELTGVVIGAFVILGLFILTSATINITMNVADTKLCTFEHDGGTYHIYCDNSFADLTSEDDDLKYVIHRGLYKTYQMSIYVAQTDDAIDIIKDRFIASYNLREGLNSENLKFKASNSERNKKYLETLKCK